MDIAAWLRSLGLERYAEAFRANEIDAAVLPELTDEHLKELGLPLGPRLKLLKAIAALRADLLSAGEPAALPPEAKPGPPTGAAAPEAERRQLTVLFCDLVGSTALAAKLDPEDTGRVIRAYQGCCTEVVERWSGHVAKYMGDGVLAYFGWPQAHEDDAERAVRAGLDLTDAIELMAAPSGEALTARVGIATGLVMVGELIGEGAAQEQAVVGETPNLAARLQSLAEPGTVVVAPATRQLLGAVFEVADLGPHTLKGFARPIQAWRVVGEGTTESRFEALHTAGLTPLVGREHELGLLLDRWQLAKDGEGQVVLLSGEPGIGKSHLGRALRERVADEPHMPLRHQCSPYRTSSALFPVIDRLERAAGFERDDGPERKLAKLEALLAEATEDVGAVAPLLAALLSIPTGDRYPPLNLTPQRQKERTLDVLVAQLEGLATKRPVLMIFEDVHWIDPTSTELLGLVIERMRGLPVLLVITFRTEFSPPWAGHAHTTTLTLNRLGRRQGAALVERVTGGKPLPAKMVEQIVAKTDGVPLFVEELTKTVLESGLLRDVGDRYELTGPLPPVAIPATLQDSLMARLDRLASVKEVAQTAAVVGREFSYRLLAAVAPLGEEQLQEALDQLVHAELVFRRGAPPEATYSFKHALVQDTAYQSLLRHKRQRLHARIGQVLEERFPEAAENQPELLARHFTEAGLAERAITYWYKAGQRAAERFAHREAIAYLTRGLDLLKSLPETSERAREEIRLQNALGVSLMATKGPAPEVAEAYVRARELSERLGDARQVYAAVWGLWFFNQMRMKFKTARDLSDELLELARREQDKELLLQAHHAAWTILLYGGELLLCREHAEHGLALYGPDEHRFHAFRYGGHDPGVCCRYQGSLALWLLGYPDQAVAMAHDAVHLARQLAQPFSLVIALNMASFVHQFRGEAELAQEQAEATIALSVEQGFPQYLAAGTLMRGWAVAAQGQLQEGMAAVHQGLGGLRAAGADLRRSYYLALLAEVCGRAGRPDEGLSAVAEALAFVEESGERWWEADLHRLKGKLLLAQSRENHAEAEACFRRACEVAGQQSAKAFELRAATSLARLRRDRGRCAEAHDLLAPIYGWFTEGFDTQDLRDARTLLDELGSTPTSSVA